MNIKEMKSEINRKTGSIGDGNIARATLCQSCTEGCASTGCTDMCISCTERCPYGCAAGCSHQCPSTGCSHQCPATGCSNICVGHGNSIPEGGKNEY